MVLYCAECVQTADGSVLCCRTKVCRLLIFLYCAVGVQTADGSVTLVKGNEGAVNVLVDTGGPWGKDSLLQGLSS